MSRCSVSHEAMWNNNQKMTKNNEARNSENYMLNLQNDLTPNVGTNTNNKTNFRTHHELKSSNINRLSTESTSLEQENNHRFQYHYQPELQQRQHTPISSQNNTLPDTNTQIPFHILNGYDKPDNISLSTLTTTDLKSNNRLQYNTDLEINFASGQHPTQPIFDVNNITSSTLDNNIRTPLLSRIIKNHSSYRISESGLTAMSQQLKNDFLEFNRCEVNKFNQSNDEVFPIFEEEQSNELPLSSAYRAVFKFPKLKHIKQTINEENSSLDRIEMNLLNTMNLKYENDELIGMFYTTMSLSSFYLRCNAIKSFKNFSYESTKEIHKLRNGLLAISSRYYGIAISKLRKIILKPNYNVSIAIFVSSYLNKISVYEYKDYHHSIAFSKGTAGIFNDSVSRNDKTISWSIKFLIKSSKSLYIPSYAPNAIYEYFEYLNDYRKQLDQCQAVISDNQFIFQLNFHCNNLVDYTKFIINLFENNSIETIRNNPSLLYKILRRYLLIVPPKVSMINYLKDQFELVLMYLFDALARFLDNILPNLPYLFFQGFKGGLTLWFNPNYQVTNKYILGGNQTNELKNILDYCIRISTFFQRRFNKLSTYFGEQKFASRSNELSPSLIAKQINEVMIYSFKNTRIDYVHYCHLPSAVKFDHNNDFLMEKLSNIEKLRLYDYNLDHYLYLKSEDSHKEAKRNINDLPFQNDPVLSHHMGNTTGKKQAKTLFKEDLTRKVEFYSRDDRSTSISPYNEEFENQSISSNTTSKSSSTRNIHPSSSPGGYYYHEYNLIKDPYDIFADPQFSKPMSEMLSGDYVRLLTTGLTHRVDDSPTLNPISGLNAHDKCPVFSLRSPMNFLHERQELDEFDKIAIMHFHRDRHEYLHRFEVSNDGDNESDDNDDTDFDECNFYDDLNYKYFMLGGNTLI